MLNEEFVVKIIEKIPHNNRDEGISCVNQLLSKQGIVKYGYYHGTRGLEYKINQETFSYDQYALKYSMELKSYSITYTRDYLTWSKSNEVPYEIRRTTSYTYESPLKGQITFKGDSCEFQTNLITGSCNIFWILTDVDLTTTVRNSLGIYLTGKDPNVIKQLKKAFIYLNELSID